MEKMMKLVITTGEVHSDGDRFDSIENEAYMVLSRRDIEGLLALVKKEGGNKDTCISIPMTASVETDGKTGNVRLQVDVKNSAQYWVSQPKSRRKL